MDEVIIFLLGMLAEALGLKAKRPATPRPPPGRAAATGAPRPAPGLPPSPAASAPSRPGPGRDLPAPRPGAGGPLDRADEAAFRRQADSLAATEPRGLEVRLDSGASAPAAPAPLFADQASLIRAVILQEVLAPPLCRRPGKRPSPTNNSHRR